VNAALEGRGRGCFQNLRQNLRHNVVPVVDRREWPHALGEAGQDSDEQRFSHISVRTCAGVQLVQQQMMFQLVSNPSLTMVMQVDKPDGQALVMQGNVAITVKAMDLALWDALTAEQVASKADTIKYGYKLISK
jgi:hypothetical protein